MTRDEKIEGYVLGSLSALERAAVARDRLVDAELDASISQLEQSMATLTGITGEITPSEDIFDSVAATILQEGRELAGIVAEGLNDGKWQGCLPGVDMKPLWGGNTMFLRCQPGASIPAHDHLRDEHMVVISGDLVIGGRTLRAGDYHMTPANNDHGESHTIDGCLILVQYAA
jgi:mannose-6-phosphate isomerase-like protein (cupin superfamily)